MQQSITFLINFFHSILNWLSDFEIIQGVSLLGVFVAFSITFILVDNFIAKG